MPIQEDAAATWVDLYIVAGEPGKGQIWRTGPDAMQPGYNTAMTGSEPTCRSCGSPVEIGFGLDFTHGGYVRSR